MAAEDVANIRVLIPDTDAIYGNAGDEYLFADEELERFFTVGGGSVLRAAGLAMIAVGNSESLISKVIVTQDLETDGAKAQKEWREAGRELLRQAALIEAGEGDAFFEIINYGQGWQPEGKELAEWPFGGRYPYGY
jgi:hypothetical protein